MIDKRPADDPSQFPAAPGMVGDCAILLRWLAETLAPRLPSRPRGGGGDARHAAHGYRGFCQARARAYVPARDSAAQGCGTWSMRRRTGQPLRPPRRAMRSMGLNQLQSIRIPGAAPHPTKLVQSAAMVSVAPPKPSYRPGLPVNIHGLLSDAQLQTVIYAWEAHSAHLVGRWRLDESFDTISAASEDATDAVRFRRGFMLGDGTGTGKGRQSAGIILDNWLQSRCRALWISKSDKLIEDAQRDWSALGMERLLVTPLSRFPQGTKISLTEGILFTTYATLRSDERGGKASMRRRRSGGGCPM